MISDTSSPSVIKNEETLDLFDFDCNLTHDDMVADVEMHMQHGAAAGVTEMLVPGATLEESQAAIDLCRKYPTQLFPTAGVHPYHALALPTPEELATLSDLAQLEECRAVGECGLDYSPSFPDAKLQQEWFKVQLDLACRLQKPLFLHERLAHDDFMALIKQCQQKFNDYFPPVVVHCFTGNEQELREYVRQGFYIGITGFICKKEHGASLRAMVQHIPLQKLVIETDAPYMGFPKCRRYEPSHPKKQYPNVPSALPQVVEAIATALGKTPQEIALITKANARRFLRLSV
uniref:TatD related DNase n=2 Tax=Globisporangium ultimum TaxID=2052682 RepID=K3WCX9_GLOUD|nr:TatD related DNase [Globisporangium ultimum]